MFILRFFLRWFVRLATVLAVVAYICLHAFSAELPDAPGRTVNKKFLILSAVGATATALDSYTTGRISSHWDGGFGSNVRACGAEGESPWLYGAHPGPARAYAVGVGQIAVANTAAYWLKRRHSRWWVVPFLAQMSAVPDVVRNVQNCF